MKGSILLTLAIYFQVFACASDSDCRFGRICHNGECRDTSTIHTKCAKDNDCPINQICINGACTDFKSMDVPTSKSYTSKVASPYLLIPRQYMRIVNTGRGGFVTTSVFYAIGTAYSSIIPCVVAFDQYGYRVDHGYGRLAIPLTAPQTLGFITFGGLNQISKSSQRRVLRELGQEPNYSHTRIGWLLYGASVATATTNILTFAADNQGVAITTSFINAGVLTVSYIYNTMIFGKQRNEIRKTIREKLEQSEGVSLGLEISPYIVYWNGNGAFGLTVGF